MTDIKAQKRLEDYFTCLRNVYNSSKTTFTKCYKISYKIHILVERLTKIQRANAVDCPLENFEGLICKLTILIDKDINRLIKELQRNCDALYRDYDTLNKKMINLDNICDEIDFRESTNLVDGSAFQPSLSELLEYSHDGTNFLHGAWSQLKFAIFCISSRDKCDFTQLLNDFYKHDEISEERINHILMMTQFCNKTEL